MDKIKRIVLIHVPVSACNFKCEYCYITQFEGRRAEQMPNFQYTPTYVATALSPKRLGGICYINICGDGETLLPAEITSYVKELLKAGHYVDVITNCILEKRIDELLQFDRQLLSRLMLKCSFHWIEMKRTNTLDIYVKNIKKLKEKGVAYTIEITPYDKLIPYIDEINDFCTKNFAGQPQITIAWDDYNGTVLLSKLSKEEFHRTWSVFNSPMIDFKISTMGVRRKEFCYAGDWSIYLNLATGMTRQCYCSNVKPFNIFENINKPINFTAIGNNCKTPHCRNSHMLLTLGTIPHLNNTYYELIRNRNCNDGTEWLSQTVKSFLNTKLEENNNEYTTRQKIITNLKNRINIYKVDSIIKKVIPLKIKNKIKVRTAVKKCSKDDE